MGNPTIGRPMNATTTPGPQMAKKNHLRPQNDPERLGPKKL